LVWRLQSDGSVQDHMGRSARVLGCWLDELGHLYLEADTGFGLVHTQDVAQAALAVEQGQWRPKDVLQTDLTAQFGFVKSPELLQKL
jgi:hypothetical protein